MSFASFICIPLGKYVANMQQNRCGNCNLPLNISSNLAIFWQNKIALPFEEIHAPEAAADDWNFADLRMKTAPDASAVQALFRTHQERKWLRFAGNGADPDHIFRN